MDSADLGPKRQLAMTVEPICAYQRTDRSSSRLLGSIDGADSTLGCLNNSHPLSLSVKRTLSPLMDFQHLISRGLLRPVHDLSHFRGLHGVC